MPSPPLAGLRVLDLTRLLPGPLASMHLADLGADVIKIEDTGAGDYARSAGAVHGDISYFQLVNRNKRSLTLDLKQAAGVEAFMRLAARRMSFSRAFDPAWWTSSASATRRVVAQSTHRLLCDHRLRAGWAVP
jgi:alpha-methylacyl-CoA racemase